MASATSPVVHASDGMVYSPQSESASTRRRKREGCGLTDRHRYWLNTEPCGIICASLTWFIVLFCGYSFVFEVVLPWLWFSVWG